MLRPLGVYQFAVVILSDASLESRNTDCTSPFPYDVVPTTTARSWSWSAPATISEADAVAPLISTTTGRVA